MSHVGQVAMVTGGGRNLGRCVALQLAEEGFDLALLGPDLQELEATAQEIVALGRRCHLGKVDFLAPDTIATAIQSVRSQFHQIDVLVNNAGIAGPTATIQNITRAEWDATLAVNLSGAFLCCQAVVDAMIQRRSGKIINISSMAGKIGFALRAPYAASKWGLIGLSMTLAKELASANIQVNAICPGPIEGSRQDEVIRDRAAQTGQTEDVVRAEILKSMALGRMVPPADIARMVAYLASAAGNNITGQAIDVAAGYAL